MCDGRHGFCCLLIAGLLDLSGGFLVSFLVLQKRSHITTNVRAGIADYGEGRVVVWGQ